jgi:predicted GIY-YIG superfamily endonuclease
MIGVYKITNPKGKIYIGQSINIEHRFKQYQYCSSNNAIGPKLFNSLKKYGSGNHTFEVIEECEIKYLNNYEEYWKGHYLKMFENDWSQVLFCNLYDNGRGPLSEETKIKKSLALKGKPMLNNQKSIQKLNLNGEVIEEFNSQLEAALSLGIKQTAAISECCTNKRKTAYGYKWKFKN